MKRSFFSILILVILSGCSKQVDSGAPKDADILSYSIEGKPAQVDIVPASHSIYITFPDSVRNADNLIADFKLSPDCKATIKNIEQVSGATKNNFSNTLYYTVSTANNIADWKVASTNNTYTAALGLGNFFQQSASNNCSYAWYIDQQNTGSDSVFNCGPTSVTMACKWSDSTFAKTPEDARIAYRPAGGWWYADDINGYLRNNAILHSTIDLAPTAEGTAAILKRQMDVHQIVILCLDMNLVRSTYDRNFHTDKFYSTVPGSGHFIVVKGYTQVDNEMFFEVYDSNSFSQKNKDGTLMGQDRYYRYEDLFAATERWWPHAFIIAKKGATLIEN